MDFAAHRKHYRDNHRTLGCKITHMFGVPMIMVAIVMLFFSWQWALGLFVGGWALQFSGHYFFEKNRPVLFSDPSNPLTYFLAIIFVAEEWVKLLTFQSLVDKDEDGK